ncbi:MAG: hypothetical protein GF398_15970 [Chitinivibrionales bacterium]|nr:hypothetical protein [Chitinivibrionales bacterium]
MVSSQQYEEFVFPHDLALSKRYDRFGMHTCNWNCDAYAETIRKIENLGYLDTGMASNLKRLKEMFPHARRAVSFFPQDLVNKPMDELEQDVVRVKNEYAPCDIILADIDVEMPDGKVVEFWEMVAQNQ